MGYAYLEFRGKSELFSDGVIWLLRDLLLDEMKQQDSVGPEFELLKKFLLDWEWPGTGVICNADFDAYVGDELPRLELVLRLLQDIGDRLFAFGEKIPVGYLHSRLPAEHRWLEDPPTRLILKQIGRLATFLSSGRHRAQIGD